MRSLRRRTDMKHMDELLRLMVEAGASDLHVKAGSPPMMRVDGELRPFELPALDPEDTKDYAASLMSDKQIRRFSETNELDFAYSAPQILSLIHISEPTR